MRALRSARVLLIGTLVAACDPVADRAPTAPSATKPAADLVLPLSGDVLEMLAEAGIPVLTPGPGEQGATGGVWYVYGGEDYQKLAFSALRKRDGTVHGQFEHRWSVGGVERRAHGVVTCLSVASGEEAYFGGRVTESDPLWTFPFMSFQIYDQGEGSNDPPDYVGGPQATECPSDLNAAPVTRGNLHIRAPR